MIIWWWNLTPLRETSSQQRIRSSARYLLAVKISAPCYIKKKKEIINKCSDETRGKSTLTNKKYFCNGPSPVGPWHIRIQENTNDWFENHLPADMQEHDSNWVVNNVRSFEPSLSVFYWLWPPRFIPISQHRHVWSTARKRKAVEEIAFDATIQQFQGPVLEAFTLAFSSRGSISNSP